MSASIENFVKVVYQFEQNRALDTRPGTIAKALGITSAAATDMSRKLSGRNLLHYEKYHKLRLTEDGKMMALHVIRKHRLWEAFLFEIFNLNLHEIHREAELLEHQTSDFLTDKISAFLGYPEFDPHGEPIPDAKGSIMLPAGQRILSTAEKGQSWQITGLLSSDKEFFEFCNNNDIKLGTLLVIENQYEKIRMTEIRTHNKRLLLNNEFANLIYVQQITENSTEL
ncbi:MAG TPA: metal-dependent transcriptional regulator [Bacteroidales bacterium]|nr:metal-dependent transcriptional regulator [Bacteroidales bacterium]